MEFDLIAFRIPLTRTTAGGVAAQLAGALVLQTFPHVLETFLSYAMCVIPSGSRYSSMVNLQGT